MTPERVAAERVRFEKRINLPASELRRDEQGYYVHELVRCYWHGFLYAVEDMEQRAQGEAVAVVVTCGRSGACVDLVPPIRELEVGAKLYTTPQQAAPAEVDAAAFAASLKQMPPDDIRRVIAEMQAVLSPESPAEVSEGFVWFPEYFVGSDHTVMWGNGHTPVEIARCKNQKIAALIAESLDERAKARSIDNFRQRIMKEKP